VNVLRQTSYIFVDCIKMTEKETKRRAITKRNARAAEAQAAEALAALATPHADDCTSQASNHVSSNSKKPWTREEVEELYYMSFHHHSVTEMVNELQRPRKNVLVALKKIKTQQALFHSLDEVALAHNTDTETLKKYLEDPLYYVRLPEQGIPSLLMTAFVVLGAVLTYGYVFFE